MANVGKASDAALDKISELLKREKAVKAWLELYQETNQIDPVVASHLWEVLTGIDTEGVPDGTASSTQGVVDSSHAR